MFKALVPAVAILFATPGAASAETTSKEVRRTVSLEKDGRVTLETFKGTVKISVWDRPQAEVVARIEADDACSDAKYQAEMVRDTEVRIEGEGTALRIRSDYDRVRGLHTWSVWPFSSCSALPFVHYTIAMPKTAKLDLSDHKSRIEIAGLESDLKLSTHKGEVYLSGIAGRVSLETHKGDVRVAFARMAGDSRLETHKGDIEITIPKDARFAVSADIGRRGRLQSDFPVTTTSGSRRREERVEAAVNGGGPELRLATHSGTFRLRSS
jgi:hypothetical protein